MTELAINTELGAQAEQDGRRAAIMVARSMGCEYVATAPKQPAAIDGFIVKEGIVIGAVEVKTRYDMTVDELFAERQGMWLVTADKVDRLLWIAAELCVPALGFLYLPKSQRLLSLRLSDADGSMRVRLIRAEGVTQATINGGKAYRVNYLIAMHAALHHEVLP